MSYTSYQYRNSEHALAHAVMAELELASESPSHGVIHVSCSATLLSNGIKSCSVQIECDAGCGYLIQAFGEEADMLQEKAVAIQSLLKRVDQNDSRSYFEGILSLFPDIMR